MAVRLLVFGAERLLKIGDHLYIDRAIRHRHDQLIALALIMQRSGAREPRGLARETFRCKLPACLLGEGIPCRIDFAEVSAAQQASERACVMMFYIGVEQAERREQPG